MWIMDDGIRLNACLDMPGNEKKYPLVLLLHGFTGHMEERHILAAARAMNEAGYAVLRAELYGHGQSGGTFAEHTLYKWLGNTLTLIDYARKLDFVTDLYLCGHSQGGLTVMLAGAMKQDVLAGIIPLSPAWMIPEGARMGELLGVRFDPEHVPEELSSWDGRKLGGNYVRVAQTIDAEAAIRRFTKPVLLIHGDQDEAVDVSWAVRAGKLYRNCKLAIIPGDNHCYDHHLPWVTAILTEWLMERRQN